MLEITDSVKMKIGWFVVLVNSDGELKLFGIPPVSHGTRRISR